MENDKSIMMDEIMENDKSKIMDEIMENDKSKIMNEIYELSVFDENFQIDFFNKSIEVKILEGIGLKNEIINEIRTEILTGLHLSESFKNLFEKNVRYIVDFTESEINQIDKGSIKLMTNKLGQIFAQVRVDGGQFGSRFPIKKEIISNSLSASNILNSLVLISLKDDLNRISEQLNCIDENIKEIKIGLQNDRIAKYYSGVNLYIEALKIENTDLKNSMINSSIKELTDAISSLTMECISKIGFVLNKKGKVADRDNYMGDIHQSFEFIHKSYLAKAAIYCQLGEINTMSKVLENYSSFIETYIVKNSDELMQVDPYNKGTKNDVWAKRKKLKLKVDEIRIGLKDNCIYLNEEN